MEWSRRTGPATSPKLVSVVIPAFNAVETIDRTLQSVRAQSYADLEILVVDDGSTDGTIDIVEQHQLLDLRVRLISAPNGGVAVARNRGVAAAASDLIATIDADDLWAPDKIARQVEAMESGGPAVGLVYTWYAVIDGDDVVTHCGPQPRAEGRVLAPMAARNLVGNGSSPLMRREAILGAGGYDPGLRTQGAQGCEDWKLYLAIAEKWEYRVVPDFLTGYRRLPCNMSSDVKQMLRSADLVIADAVSRRPELAPRFADARKDLLRHLLYLTLRNERWPAATAIAAELFRDDPAFAALTVLRGGVRGALPTLGRPATDSPAFLKRLERRFAPAAARSPEIEIRIPATERLEASGAPCIESHGPVH